MNIQEELKNDRLAVDAETPHVFIREDLYKELLDTSMFPYALRAIKLARWKKWLLIAMASLCPGKYEQMVVEQQFKYYLDKLLEYVTEERIRVMGMTPASVLTALNFTIVDKDVKPLYIGAYVKSGEKGKLGEFFLRRYMCKVES